ncbi:MAG: long-chain fatty acid--CoA ligase, partial [Alphaproteobacteria bacterium]
MVSLFDITAKRASLAPERPAMTELVSGETVSYGALDNRAARAATLLGTLPVEAGERVAVLCRNRIAFFELLFACAKRGAVMVPLNWRMPVAELAGLLADCTPRALFYGREDEAAARALADGGLPAVGLDIDYEARRDACAPLVSRADWPGDDVWYLLYTSGTTGRPKAVIQTFAMALVNCINMGSAIGITARDRTLNFLPLFHTAGINLHSLPTLILGGHVLVLPGFDVDRVIGLVDEEALDTFFGVPAVYQQLAEHPRFDEAGLTRVRSWTCGGAPLPDRLVRRFAERGARVRNGFGMTETGPTCFLMDEAAVETKIGAVGKPQLLADARIVRPDGTPADVGEVGEL